MFFKFLERLGGEKPGLLLGFFLLSLGFCHLLDGDGRVSSGHNRDSRVEAFADVFRGEGADAESPESFEAEGLALDE